MSLVELIANPASIHSRETVLSKPCPVPAKPGVYAWFFKDIPGALPTTDRVTKEGLTLLYVGISPKNALSSQNLRRRITYHYRGNAEGSTLRLTLGVLLSGESGYPLRRVRKRLSNDIYSFGRAMLERLDGAKCLCVVDRASRALDGRSCSFEEPSTTVEYPRQLAPELSPIFGDGLMGQAAANLA